MSKPIRSILIFFLLFLCFLIMYSAILAAEKGSPASPNNSGSVTGIQGGFRLLAYSNAINQLAKETCTKTSVMKDHNNRGTVYSCYGFEWQGWVKQVFKKKTNQFRKSIDRDMGTMIPATSLLEYPDGSARLVFGGCRAHFCDDARVYVLVDPKGRDMDIIWRSDTGLKYIGQNQRILDQSKIDDFLDNNWPDL